MLVFLTKHGLSVKSIPHQKTQAPIPTSQSHHHLAQQATYMTPKDAIKKQLITKAAHSIHSNIQTDLSHQSQTIMTKQQQLYDQLQACQSQHQAERSQTSRLVHQDMQVQSQIQKVKLPRSHITVKKRDFLQASHIQKETEQIMNMIKRADLKEAKIPKTRTHSTKNLKESFWKMDSKLTYQQQAYQRQEPTLLSKPRMEKRSE